LRSSIFWHHDAGMTTEATTITADLDAKEAPIELREVSAAGQLAIKRPDLLIGAALLVFFFNMGMAWWMAVQSGQSIQAAIRTGTWSTNSAYASILKAAPQASANTFFLLHRSLEVTLIDRLVSNKQSVMVVGMGISFALMAIGFALYVIGTQSAIRFSGESGNSIKLALRACFKNISEGLAAGRGGWLRCSSVTDFFQYAPSSRLAIRTAALAIPFQPIFKTGS
jgi:hypothetical protein